MYKNFRIYRTENNTYILRADGERFGKQAIIFESYKLNEVIRFMYANYTNKEGKVITNLRWTNWVYTKAMTTCNIPDNPWYMATEATM